MATPVDPRDVSTSGLEFSPHAEALAGPRANEARHFHTKYQHVFEVSPVADGGKRAVGSKPCQGMDVPDELSAVKFACQKSKLATGWWPS